MHTNGYISAQLCSSMDLHDCSIHISLEINYSILNKRFYFSPVNLEKLSMKVLSPNPNLHICGFLKVNSFHDLSQ